LLSKQSRETECLSEVLKNDIEIVTEAIKRNGPSIQFASEELKNNQDLARIALKNSATLSDVGKELKRKKEFVLEAIKNQRGSFIHASEELRNDREIILESIKSNQTNFNLLSKEFMNDREIILNAVKHDENAFELLTKNYPEYKNDKEIVLAAVQYNGKVLKFVSEDLKNDEEVAMHVLNSYGSFEYIGNGFKNNKEFYYKAAKIKAFDSLDHEFMDERDFVLKIVQLNGYLLESASEVLKDDKEIVLEAVKNSNSLEFASDRLKNDEEIVLEYIKNFPESLYDLGEKFFENKEFLFKALRVNPLIVFETEIDDIELLLIAYKWHKLIKQVNTFNLNFKFE
jgi:hypothetical protein